MIIQEGLKDSNGLYEKEYLENYNLKKYDNTILSVDNIVLTIDMRENPDSPRKRPIKVLQVLLTERGEHPYLNHWTLSGSFTNSSESAIETSYRSLKDKTGLQDIYMEELKLWDQKGRDPRGDIASQSFLALVDKDKVSIKAGANAKNTDWFDVSSKVIETSMEEQEDKIVVSQLKEVVFENIKRNIKINYVFEEKTVFLGNIHWTYYTVLKRDGLGFDHGLMVDYALQFLREKGKESDMIFNLLPFKFTYRQLADVLDVILNTNKNLDIANVRRDFSKTGKIIETDEYFEGLASRKAKLCVFNPYYKFSSNNE